MLLGAWTGTWQGADESQAPTGTPTLAESLGHAAGAAHAASVEAITTMASEADVIVVALGETPSVEKPGDRNDLELDPDSRTAAEAALATGLPVVLVLLSDRPLRIGDLVDRTAAVLWAGRPGSSGAEAIADVLTGRFPPEGRLPFTWPRHPHPLLPYDHRHSDRLSRTYGLIPETRFDAFDPQWRFGEGLSYGDVAIEAMDLAAGTVDPDDEVVVCVTLVNRGSTAVAETLQVYVSDRFASIAPAVERLRAFGKVHLGPGATESAELRFPAADLSFEAPGGRRLEEGTFEVRVGPHVRELELRTGR